MKQLARTALLAMLLSSSAARTQVPPHQPGTVCFTPQVWCWMQRWGPPGSTCYCPGPYGLIMGVVG